MAKELLLVFIYDCELCKKEEDDPQDAITYFYPAWVNNEQRHALCSQLMGVTQFCSSTFSLPKVIALRSGKFSIKKLGRYALCVGSDRNIPDVVLETRSKILYNLLRLFHNSIELLNESLSDDDDNISDKLSELLQVYLPILQYATNTFGNIPVLKIPKSTSTLFLEAMHTLQGFQEIHGVLGGTLLYQNKVVATQLNNTLTKQLVVTDPYRIKLPAETVQTSFHLPVGVQLLKVYIPSSEVRRLKEENKELYTALNEIKNWRKDLENQNNNKNMCVKPPDSSVSMCGLKRDVSRIFTVLEEEGTEILEAKDTPDVPDVVRDAVKARHLARIESVTASSFIIRPPCNKVQKSLTPDDVPSTRKIPIRYYSIGLPQINSDWCDTPPKNGPRPYYNTICDPKYPLFKPDGLPISQSLSESWLLGEYEGLKIENKKKGNCSAKQSRPQTEQNTGVKEKPKSLELKSKQQKPKRSFTLPLNSNPGPLTHGVPLTPLMAKLSLLAEEGCTIETPLKTPSSGLKTLREVARIPPSESLPSQSAKERFQNENKKSNEHNSFNECNLDEETDDLVSSVLYVFGVNNTCVLLLIDPHIAVQPEVVHSLWERSMASLKHMESRLRTCLSATENNGSTEYSYALVDPAWGPIERGGAYHPHQLELLTILHHTLLKRPFITDILVRSEDTLTYGYQCAETQVFYQENCIGLPGLPTPSDLMGVIPLKAKRVLERDHGVILL